MHIADDGVCEQFVDLGAAGDFGEPAAGAAYFSDDHVVLHVVGLLMGSIVWCNHMVWGILVGRLRLVTVSFGHSFPAVLDTPLVCRTPPPGIRGEGCWCISTTCEALLCLRLWLSRLVLYAENAFDKATIVCHRVRARIRARLRHLRGATPGSNHMGHLWGAVWTKRRFLKTAP